MVAALLFGSLATPVYWVIWYFVDRSLLAVTDTTVYLGYQNAFPIADAWMTVGSAMGAQSLLRRRSAALLWMLLGGSASIFLALLDVLFDLENGLYRARNGDLGSVVVEVLVNLLTLFLGTAAVVWAWRHRKTLMTWA